MLARRVARAALAAALLVVATVARADTPPASPDESNAPAAPADATPAGPASADKEGWDRWKEVFGSGRLLATGGVTQVEGSAGGGLVPWAVLAGYGSEDQIGGTAFYTRVPAEDLMIQAYGGALSFLQRVEISAAGQTADLGGPIHEDVSQVIFGAKVRLFGDLVYTPWPTVALGVQYKRNLDYSIPESLGSRHREDADFYLAASKVFLNGLFGFPVLLNTTVRATRANELGLLGFGGPHQNEYEPMFEGSALLFFTRHLAIGGEFRQKPQNLRTVDEDNWADAFLAVFINKHLSLVGGYVRMGDVAVWQNQDSYYLNVQAGF
ncbi:MAG TPA: DUF3034 family protein [Myxococcota bacterium]|nr:DUF3034 family protein [Myxococcota bacterium]